MNINDCRIIELPKFLDERGNLSFVENYSQIPFEIKRTYWLYDVPGGITRGGHAEINNEELIIAISGSFEIYVSDGKREKTFTLNRSYYGLYIPKGLWREIKEFSTNSLALEFGSIEYDEKDYIRDYDSFLSYTETNTLPIDNTKKNKELIKYKENIKYNVFDCTIVELDTHHSDRKGNLAVMQNGKTLPFDIKRAYDLHMLCSL